MKKLLSLALLSSLVLALTACSGLRFPGVHRIKIQQGNYVEQEMVDKLEKGMTRRQVQFILGSALVADSFHKDRWDYYYSVSRNNKASKEYLFTVFFEDDLLSRWEGDYADAIKAKILEEQKANQEAEKKAEAKKKTETEAEAKKAEDTAP